MCNIVSIVIIQIWTSILLDMKLILHYVVYSSALWISFSAIYYGFLNASPLYWKQKHSFVFTPCMSYDDDFLGFLHVVNVKTNFTNAELIVEFIVVWLQYCFCDT